MTEQELYSIDNLKKMFLEFDTWAEAKVQLKNYFEEYNGNTSSNFKETDFKDIYSETHKLRRQKIKSIKKEETAKRSLNLENSADIFSRRSQAEQFYREQPFFYDKNCFFWLWDKINFKYRRIDEIDLLNGISEIIHLDTTDGKKQSEILRALQQVGRLKLPKELQKTEIQFKNIVYEVKSGFSRKASPDYFSTNVIPWGVGDSEETPTIDKLFHDWVSSQYVQTLYEIVAYCACSDQFLQRIIALTGAGRNGKGTFLELLTKFLGLENVCSSELRILSSNHFEASSLYKKLACLMGEVSWNDLTNTNLIKKLSGSDLIRYEFKGKTSFSELSPTTCVIATNSLPKTPDSSEGFYRRWLILDFPNQFEIKSGLIDSIPEIEFWNLAKKSISMLKILYANQYFTREGTIEARQERYEAHSNPLRAYLEEFYEEIPDSRIPLREFSTAFNEHLKTKKLRTMTTRQVSFQLKEEGLLVGNRKNKEGDSQVVILNLAPKTIETIKTIEVPSQNPYKETTEIHDSFDSNNSNFALITPKVYSADEYLALKKAEEEAQK